MHYHGGMSRPAQRAAQVAPTLPGRVWSALAEWSGNLRQVWQGYWLSPPGC